eukprot:730568-Prymnesium_polylepis.1
MNTTDYSSADQGTIKIVIRLARDRNQNHDSIRARALTRLRGGRSCPTRRTRIRHQSVAVEAHGARQLLNTKSGTARTGPSWGH